MMIVFFHGFCLALGLILPLGVQNMFIFQQGITQVGFVAVLPAIAAAAICDTVLIVLAVSGLSAAIAAFSALKGFILLGGGICLLYMGYANWKGGNGLTEGKKESLSAKQQIIFAVSVSLFNPSAFIDIMGVIGVNSLQYESLDKLVFTLATILVSWIWFLGLGLLGHYFGELPNIENKLPIMNKLSSLFIWGAAAYLAAMFFYQ
jgi:L-lysine exporter family protein LysE/ArgO